MITPKSDKNASQLSLPESQRKFSLRALATGDPQELEPTPKNLKSTIRLIL